MSSGQLDRLVVTGPAVEVAPRLLGLELQTAGRAGVIVEVEAYEGSDDPASHAFRGPTDRNLVMFGPPGHLYVYRSYGIHWCANVVCGEGGRAAAVLIRAVEPVGGIDRMWGDRPKARKETDLASGPGKVCAALGIDGGHGGTDLLDPIAPVRLVAAGELGGTPAIVSGPRVGITKAVERSWRFAIAGNDHVSRPRTGLQRLTP